MERMTGMSAVVFGADDITKGITTRFLDEGAHVTVLDSDWSLSSITPRPDLVLHSLAGRKSSDITLALGATVGDGPLDVLVIGGGDIVDESRWTAIEEVNQSTLMADTEHEVGAALAVARCAAPALRHRGGSIIFMFSPAGLYSEGGWGGAPVVHHAKRGLARTLAAEWGEHQIRVNTLVPLASTRAFETYRARNPEVVDWRVSKTPMRRVGDPVRDVGGAAVFLASADCRYLTGSVIFADGGAFLTAPVIDSSTYRI